MDLNELLARQQLAIKIAHKAGEIINGKDGKSITIDEKCSFADLVTESDKAVEEMVYKEIQEHFPNDKFIGEESANDIQLTSDPTWVIDPIDGTTNFIHGFPFCCISIGFCYNKEAVMGVIYHPHQDHLYTAIKGQGAKLIKGNNETVELRVRPCKSLSQALVISEMGSQRDNDKRECVLKNFTAIGWSSHGVRSLGSCALNICAVASGQMDAFFEFGPYIWDVCAGVVIVLEAGGYVCDTTGKEFDLLARRFIVASSEELAQEMAKKMVVQLDLKPKN